VRASGATEPAAASRPVDFGVEPKIDVGTR
jgi:hypothetical protein